MSRLERLHECGQSYWLDHLTGAMIREGELQRRISHEGLRGVTVNPSMFAVAFASGPYDSDIRGLAQGGKGSGEMYESLLVADVQEACDLFIGLHDTSARVDGYVSLDLSPHLAHDAVGTMREARRFRALVDRPNLLIKVPGTTAGFLAIEQLIYEGISVNVTLLCSLPTYEAVMEAYVAGLERRSAERRPLMEVSCVASFFLGRIDCLVDQLLEQRDRPSDGRALSAGLRGKAAVALAKLAYRSFRRTFSGERWDRLAVKGANLQRPLWASTSTKDVPNRDLMYVEALIGRDTVTTMSEQTIQAFKDHGEVKPNEIERGVEEAARTIQSLSEAGIDLHCVAWQLEHEGIKQLTEAFDRADRELEEKRRRAVTKPAAA